jgi:hypothetical protein
LPEVVGASLNPDAVAAPLRQMLSGVRCRTESVRFVDVQRQLIEFEAHDGHTRTLHTTTSSSPAAAPRQRAPPTREPSV